MTVRSAAKPVVEHRIEADLLERRRQPLEHHALHPRPAAPLDQGRRHGRRDLRDDHGAGRASPRPRRRPGRAPRSRPWGTRARTGRSRHTGSGVSPTLKPGATLVLNPGRRRRWRPPPCTSWQVVTRGRRARTCWGRATEPGSRCPPGAACARRRSGRGARPARGERGELRRSPDRTTTEAYPGMAADEQLHDRAPRLQHSRRVRVHRHALGGLERAAREEPRFALDLHHAEAAGGGGVGAQSREQRCGMSTPARPAALSTSRPGRPRSRRRVMVSFMVAPLTPPASTACLGHASAQAPQPVQRSTMMEWANLRLPMTASFGQFLAHSAQPVQSSGSMSNTRSPVQAPAGHAVSITWASYSSRKNTQRAQHGFAADWPRRRGSSP